MQGMAAQIARLRARIADIERRPAFAGTAADSSRDGQPGPIATPRGALHEVFADDLRGAGAALGFALGQAQGLIGSGRPALIVVQLGREGAEAGLPYGPGLNQFGIDPDRLTLVRAETIIDLLWAVEEAVVCAAVAAVVVDLAQQHKALDFTASRRLALRAEATGTSALIVRYGTGREASAARYRWRVDPATSAPPPFDQRAPGLPRFSVTLEKGRLDACSEGASLILDWTIADGFTLVDPGTGRTAPAPVLEPPPPRAQPAALGDRLPETG